MYVTEHAGQRMWERFNINSSKILGLVQNAKETFMVTDRKLSYDLSVDLGRRKIVVARNPKAYFVLDHRDNVVTVLTEEQAMNNLKVGKWTKL